VECCQHHTDSTHRPRKSRFRQRVCPRKGCEAVYTPRAGNQRYCQDPQCRQEVRSWQAAGRRKQWRLRPEVRKTQAAAAKVARLRKSRLNCHPPLPAEHHGVAMVIQGSSFRKKGETASSQWQSADSQSQRTELGLESPSYLHWRSFVVHSASSGVSPLVTTLTSVLWLRPQRRAAPSPSGETELSRHSRHATAVDGDSDLPFPHTRDATTLLCSTAHDDN